LLSFLSFAAVGLVLASLFPSSRTAQAVGSAIYFPQMFLSGAAFPREMFPEGMKRATEFLPMTQINILITEIWQKGTWNLTAVVVLVIIGVVAGVAAVKLFRWE
jgi:ABC-2 type transport system permease protein